MKRRVLLLGGGAREHALAEALCRNPEVELVTVAATLNPGIDALSEKYVQHDETDAMWLLLWAVQHGIDMAVVGAEGPLARGVVDVLENEGIKTLGPSQSAAQLETSKLFLRDLMERHRIQGNIPYQYFTNPLKLENFLLRQRAEYALKPIGGTSGKGVKVMGVQLESVDEAIAYGKKVIKEQIGGQAGILVEERVVGQEFTLQAFADGKTLIPMPSVQDFKKAYEGDEGPNTGSMGSVSEVGGSLPYVEETLAAEAFAILGEIVSALECEEISYRGIIYGQFIVSSSGLKLVEINVRFGDPEALNVLMLLENDFTTICDNIIGGTLNTREVKFSPEATVCKYITPPGYPLEPQEGVPIKFNQEAINDLGVKLYFAQVVPLAEGVVATTRSRTLALAAQGETVAAAEEKVEKALRFIEGSCHVRHDIGRNI